MSDDSLSCTVQFSCDTYKYKSILGRAVGMGLAAVAEKAATDTNTYVKYDSGTLHDTQRVEYVKDEQGHTKEVIISWNTPYALYQYFYPVAINHGKGDGIPHPEWAKYAEDLHGESWNKTMQKGVDLGLM